MKIKYNKKRITSNIKRKKISMRKVITRPTKIKKIQQKKNEKRITNFHDEEINVLPYNLAVIYDK